MVDRISALAGHRLPDHVDDTGNAGVILREVPDLLLQQIAAWPETMDEVGRQVAKAIGAKAVAGPRSSVTGSNGAMLRIEPMKWWLVGAAAPEFDAEKAVTLDLSHARTRVCVSGEDAVEFLNRHFPLDLREASFPEGAVASSATHHVGVTLWRSADGYELFMPRGFALSLWEGFVESARQFGVEIA